MDGTKPATALVRRWAPPALLIGLVLVPQLLFSSPSWRADPRFAALLAFACLAKVLAPPAPSAGRTAILFVLALLVAHLAAWTGGLLHGSSVLAATSLAAAGLVAVAGVHVAVSVFLDPRWRPMLKWTGVGLLAVLLAASLAGYFLPIEKLIPMGGHLRYFEPTRLALIWPTRLPMRWIGQIAWEHANNAGFLFAIGWVMTLEFLALKRGGRRLPWWTLAVFAGAAVFLTGSRTAWLMVLGALPLVLVKRPAAFFVPALALAGVSLVLGFASLRMKEHLIRSPSASTAAPASNLHVEGLVERGSAGRLHAYETLWRDFSGAKTFGKGLAATGRPVAQLLHEHSSYLATFRGGGFVALAAHAAVLLVSLHAAIVLCLRGVRWPLVLLVAVLAGLLFDRGNVFVMSGRYEFAFHWVALLIPLALSRRVKSPE